MNLMTICGAVVCVLMLAWIVMRRLRAKGEIEAKSIEPDALYELLKVVVGLEVFF